MPSNKKKSVTNETSEKENISKDFQNKSLKDNDETNFGLVSEFSKIEP